MMKKIGILGGTFDPVHFGHIRIAEELYKKAWVDEIWLMPTYVSPHKNHEPIATAEDRIAMLRLATAEYPYIYVDSYEASKQRTSYTIETVLYLQARYPDFQFFWIIGSDLAYTLPQWKEYMGLIDLIQFLVVARPGYEWPNAITISSLPISSSYVREMILQDQPIEKLVPASVLEYMKRKHIYGRHS